MVLLLVIGGFGLVLAIVYGEVFADSSALKERGWTSLVASEVSAIRARMIRTHTRSVIQANHSIPAQA
jgi:hypothetical protein